MEAMDTSMQSPRDDSMQTMDDPFEEEEQSYPKRWSFISEASFSSVAFSDLPEDQIVLEPFPEEMSALDEYNGGYGQNSTVQCDEREGTSSMRHVSSLSLSMSPPTGAMSQIASIALHEEYLKDAEYRGIPMVGRKSNAPSLPIQLLQEDAHQSDDLHGVRQSFFNHALYGSLRPGDSVSLFSHVCFGLACSAMAGGFLMSFMMQCFNPLLCVYLELNYAQERAVYRFLLLPGVIGLVIGIVSDFYPLRGYHRKIYMLIGWIIAYVMLMALVVVAVVDDNKDFMETSARTYKGGIVYILLVMAVSLGITIASVIAFALVVELSQRERIYERGRLMVSYLLTLETSSLVGYIVASSVTSYDSSLNRTTSVISMKVLLLIMALVTLLPIPAIIFRLSEYRRDDKVDPGERASLLYRVWKIVQQQAVWRIVLFICGAFLFAGFEFQVAKEAVFYWSNVTPDDIRLGLISRQAVLVAVLLIFRQFLLNHCWIRIAIVGLIVGIVMDAVATIPVVFDWIRDPWYLFSMLSFVGIPSAVSLFLTSLPIVEITEAGIEGATAGLIISFKVLIASVIKTFSDAVSNSTHSLVRDFSPKYLEADSSTTRFRVFKVLMGNYGINLFALIPILYLLPRQKLDAQQMRAYGGFSQMGGTAVIVIFVSLVIYAAVVNLLTLVETY